MRNQRKQIVPISSRPDFIAEWQPTNDAVLENLKYGSARHRVVIDEHGNVKNDQIQLIEPGGASCLPINAEGSVALVWNYRHGVLKDNHVGKYPNFVAPNDFGVLMAEAPRGYRELDEDVSVTFWRELLEETSLTVKSSQKVGRVVMNSAILPVPIDLYFATVEGEPKCQAEEGIESIRFYSPEGIRDMLMAGEIRCGITLALLAHAYSRHVLP